MTCKCKTCSNRKCRKKATSNSICSLKPVTVASKSELNCPPEIVDTYFSNSGLHLNSPSEPSIGVNPSDSCNLIAAWMEDKLSYGGGAAGIGAAYSKNGGKSWNYVSIPSV